MKKSLRYYFHLSWFHFREPFSDLKTSFVTFFLYAFFVVLLTQLWQRYNSLNSLFIRNEVLLYIGVTESLFMTFLRSNSIVAASEDFAISLVRPRHWFIRECVTLLSTTFGQRLIFAAILIPTLALNGAWPSQFPVVYLRYFSIYVILALPQALISLTFSTLRLSFPQTDYFILPFGKIFLALGGVFGPLSDYGEPWRTLFLQLPGSGLFFQPAYFVVKGSFYQTDSLHWLGRIGFLCIFFLLLNVYLYRKGRRSFQAWGG
jgi:hypothetical protein